MRTLQQKFIEGFLKRASESGLPEAQIDSLTKKAFFGPAMEMGYYGLPSALGMGAGYLREKAKTNHFRDVSDTPEEFKKKLLTRVIEDRPSLLGRGAKFMFVPGYTGYRLGKGMGRESALKQIRKENFISRLIELKENVAQGKLSPAQAAAASIYSDPSKISREEMDRQTAWFTGHPEAIPKEFQGAAAASK
jgi:hypothetical protein